ncbi:DsbA family oxidoreductase [Rheinheimera sp.]|uniref:DsbA family oxidoreductase n=1 Tax=Rheinheimera sp. TaxID=1869214 RepID=UPI002FDE0021
MKTIRIDLVSDIACPWCAIGFARLQQAFKTLPELQLQLHWRAFELNPDPNLVPEPILPALSKKYGQSEEAMRQSQQNLMAIAADLGLNFQKMQQRYTCNTFDAHRLMYWASSFNRQDQLALALFEAYFGEAQNMAEPEVLSHCVAKAGLDSAAAKTLLASEQYAAEVRAELEQARHNGIHSVPAFIINQRYLISGAQEPAVLAQALQQIADEQQSANSSSR